MARHDDSGGVSALVRHTAGMAELAINAGHPDRKHNEYLPYPDNNFNDFVDERFQRGLFDYIFLFLIHFIYLIN
jgi:hypothetical protein